MSCKECRKTKRCDAISMPASLNPTSTALHTKIDIPGPVLLALDVIVSIFIPCNVLRERLTVKEDSIIRLVSDEQNPRGTIIANVTETLRREADHLKLCGYVCT